MTNAPRPTSFTLRPVVEADVSRFFAFQTDPESYRLAGVPPRDRAAFNEHWASLIVDDEVIARTIVADGAVAGFCVHFERDGERLVGYWLGQDFWGRGIASAALRSFLPLVPTRPLLAYVARHNAGSIRVLQKNGFTKLRDGVNTNGPDEQSVDEHVFVLTD